jgi:hypothetical protein
VSTYGEALKKQSRAPQKTAVLPVTAWAWDFVERPLEDVCVGLRLPSEQDVQVARAEAARIAWEMHPTPEDEDNRVDAFNDACMRWILAKALCTPNDVTRNYFEVPEDTVPAAFNTTGIQLLWDALEEAYDEASPIMPAEATDEELAGLAEAIRALPETKQPRFRRLAAALLAELADAVR